MHFNFQKTLVHKYQNNWLWAKGRGGGGGVCQTQTFCTKRRIFVLYIQLFIRPFRLRSKIKYRKKNTIEIPAYK